MVRSGAVRQWAIQLAAAAAAGVFLGVVGPFGSFFNGPIEQRIAYWVVSLMLGTTLFGLTVRGAVLVGRRFGFPDWFAASVAILAAAAPLAAAVSAVVPRLWPEVTWLKFGDFYGQVLVITAPLVGGYLLLQRLIAGRAGPAPPPDATAEPLPQALGPEVLCLQMEDHYVRIHTARGSKLVLGTLASAIAALKGVEGLQTHRSWWVARSAVTGAATEGRNLRLILSNGLKAPVSRTHVTRLKGAGWL